jgi:hypothetical protein
MVDLNSLTLDTFEKRETGIDLNSLTLDVSTPAPAISEPSPLPENTNSGYLVSSIAMMQNLKNDLQTAMDSIGGEDYSNELASIDSAMMNVADVTKTSIKADERRWGEGFTDAMKVLGQAFNPQGIEGLEPPPRMHPDAGTYSPSGPSEMLQHRADWQLRKYGTMTLDDEMRRNILNNTDHMPELPLGSTWDKTKEVGKEFVAGAVSSVKGLRVREIVEYNRAITDKQFAENLVLKSGRVPTKRESFLASEGVKTYKKQYGTAPKGRDLRQIRVGAYLTASANRFNNMAALEEAIPTLKQFRNEGTTYQAMKGMARFMPAMIASMGNPAVGVFVTFNTILGTEFDSYKANGVKDETALTAALTKAIMQTPVEFTGNMLQIGFMKGAFKAVLGKNISDTVADRILGGIRRSMAQAAIEAGEEGIQQQAEPFADVIAANPDLRWGPNGDQDKYFDKVGDILTSPRHWAETGRSAELGYVGGLWMGGITETLTNTADRLRNAVIDKTANDTKAKIKEFATQVRELEGKAKRVADAKARIAVLQHEKKNLKNGITEMEERAKGLVTIQQKASENVDTIVQDLIDEGGNLHKSYDAGAALDDTGVGIVERKLDELEIQRTQLRDEMKALLPTQSQEEQDQFTALRDRRNDVKDQIKIMSHMLDGAMQSKLGTVLPGDTTLEDGVPFPTFRRAHNQLVKQKQKIFQQNAKYRRAPAEINPGKIDPGLVITPVKDGYVLRPAPENLGHVEFHASSDHLPQSVETLYQDVIKIMSDENHALRPILDELHDNGYRFMIAGNQLGYEHGHRKMTGQPYQTKDGFLGLHSPAHDLITIQIGTMSQWNERTTQARRNVEETLWHEAIHALINLNFKKYMFAEMPPAPKADATQAVKDAWKKEAQAAIDETQRLREEGFTVFNQLRDIWESIPESEMEKYTGENINYATLSDAEKTIRSRIYQINSAYELGHRGNGIRNPASYNKNSWNMSGLRTFEELLTSAYSAPAFAKWLHSFEYAGTNDTGTTGVWSKLQNWVLQEVSKFKKVQENPTVLDAITRTTEDWLDIQLFDNKKHTLTKAERDALAKEEMHRRKNNNKQEYVNYHVEPNKEGVLPEDINLATVAGRTVGVPIRAEGRASGLAYFTVMPNTGKGIHPDTLAIPETVVAEWESKVKRAENGENPLDYDEAELGAHFDLTGEIVEHGDFAQGRDINNYAVDTRKEVYMNYPGTWDNVDALLEAINTSPYDERLSRLAIELEPFRGSGASEVHPAAIKDLFFDAGISVVRYDAVETGTPALMAIDDFAVRPDNRNNVTVENLISQAQAKLDMRKNIGTEASKAISELQIEADTLNAQPEAALMNPPKGKPLKKEPIFMRMFGPLTRAYDRYIGKNAWTFLSETAPEWMADHSRAIDYLFSKSFEDFKKDLEYLKFRRDAQLSIHKWKIIGDELNNALKGLTRAEQLRAAQIIEGSIVSPSQRKKYDAAIKAMNRFQQLETELTKMGLLRDHQFRDLTRSERAKSINRVREINNSIELQETALRDIHEKGKIKGAFAGNLADSLKANSKKLKDLIEERTEILARLQIHYKNSGKNYLRRIFDRAFQVRDFNAKYDKVRVRAKFAIQRANWDVQVGDNGEVKVSTAPIPKHLRLAGVGTRVQKGLSEEAHDLHTMELFNRIAANENWFSKHPVAGFTQMPDVKSLGPLAGAWVEPHIAEDLTEYYQQKGEVAKLYNKAWSRWKAGKTVWNPATQARNFVSNAILADMIADVNILRPTVLASGFQARRAINKSMNGGPEVEGFVKDLKYNTLILDTTFTSAELEGMEKFFDFSQIKTEYDMLNRILELFENNVKDLGRKAFSLVEESQKAAVYLEHRKRGATNEEAAAIAQKSLFDYKNVPALIRWMRNWYSPFVTFTYKAMPRLAETAIRKPWKVAKYYGFYKSIEAVSLLWNGDTPEDLERKKRVLPDYMRRRILPGMISHVRVPGIGEGQKENWLDLSFLVPWGDLSESWGEMDIGYRAFMPNNPIVNFAADIYANEEIFLDKPLTLKFEDGGEVWAKIAGHAWNQIAPANPLIPGTKKWDKLMGAIHGDLNIKGERKRSIGAAVAELAFGLKIRNVEEWEQFGWRSKELDEEYQDLHGWYEDQYKDIYFTHRDNWTQDEKQKAMDKATRRFNEELEEIIDKRAYIMNMDSDE